MRSRVPNELVTGEAVALDIRVARLPSRALALFIDVLFQMMVLDFSLTFVNVSALVADSAVIAGLMILVVVGVLVGYPAVTETLTRGHTLGKLALGLRVVADDGGPERFRQALVRALAAFVEIWALAGSPALITSLLNRRGKRLGDLFAGTIVIQERVPVTAILGPVAVMPPWLAPWATSLELSLLPDNVALAARQYLMRFWELAPLVRDEMGRRLIDEVMAYVSPPPPPGFRPEIYLSAILAERRHREERRLAERAARRAAIARRGLPLTVGAPPGPATAGGPPPPPPAPYGLAPAPYGSAPAPTPEWLNRAPNSVHHPTFFPPSG